MLFKDFPLHHPLHHHHHHQTAVAVAVAAVAVAVAAVAVAVDDFLPIALADPAEVVVHHQYQHQLAANKFFIITNTKPLTKYRC